MAMSRKHYREVAEIIKSEREEWDTAAEYTPEQRNAVRAATFIIASGLATMFQIDNANFDRKKFLEACGIE